MKEVETNLFIIGACVSTICVFALIITCCIYPKWCHNMVNYVSSHQILFGTYQLICICIRNMGPNTTVERIDADYYFLLVSVCWSFCASSIAYWKLVEVKARLCYEKKVATAFSYGMFLFVLLFDAVIPNIIEIDEIINNHQILKMIPVVMMLAINFIIFICIVISVCCNTSICDRYDSSTHRALFGVAMDCDIIAFGYFVAMFVCIFNHKDFTWMYDMYLFATVLYCCRIPFCTTHVLTSKFSVELYKSYFDRQERGSENELN